jgi:hypothetical protein
MAAHLGELAVIDHWTEEGSLRHRIANANSRARAVEAAVNSSAMARSTTPRPVAVYSCPALRKAPSGEVVADCFGKARSGTVRDGRQNALYVHAAADHIPGGAATGAAIVRNAALPAISFTASEVDNALRQAGFKQDFDDGLGAKGVVRCWLPDSGIAGHSEGPSFQHGMESGKFKGVMSPAAPNGSRSV